MPHHSGRHFRQIPGPTNVPDRVLRAISAPTIDHRGPEFSDLSREVLDGLKPVFGTEGPVVAYPSSGTGAWEAALANTLSPGDRVLMVETGHFASLWRSMAERLGLNVELIPTDWRGGADPALIGERLSEDGSLRTRSMGSKPSPWFTTRPPRDARPGYRRSGRRWTAWNTRRS